MLMIAKLPNGMINVPADQLTELGIDTTTAGRLIREAKLALLRAERDRLLAASDKTQLPDAPYSAEQRSAWQAYRKQLRDMPESVADLDHVSWPALPA
ncbi:phage tail assembly chaperone [Chromobacterium haemolyticum]|uniref:Phage tail assembly chaperone n=1 Tax=Chromobacterium haemolyticum TaxID=394935 RepID=A0ABS3GGB4_9NEIS|nr:MULTISPECIES: tail fiber assembly protein [Chromobacterium]MBK0412987.1 phage tail assembly chaperone [Chromobacterium haemolyticum]MBO0414089.1 phage tail assembly chaperone [Chromobacterium haemolyticum]MBO0497349.1 phage tail assembly chaperone [Chromobacterium haemolyticum]OQS34847.1 hypothetical protein B0T40_14715 [Chromobacterium haemolyticum]QOZ82352.1 hypothetical protein DXT74_04270 [Chromobacterium sp. Rain0013]